MLSAPRQGVTPCHSARRRTLRFRPASHVVVPTVVTRPHPDLRHTLSSRLPRSSRGAQRGICFSQSPPEHPETSSHPKDQSSLAMGNRYSSHELCTRHIPSHGIGDIVPPLFQGRLRLNSASAFPGCGHTAREEVRQSAANETRGHGTQQGAARVVKLCVTQPKKSTERAVVPPVYEKE